MRGMMRRGHLPGHVADGEGLVVEEVVEVLLDDLGRGPRRW